MFNALSPEECVSLLKAFDFASANLIVYGAVSIWKPLAITNAGDCYPSHPGRK
jgi:hypothetical protein